MPPTALDSFERLYALRVSLRPPAQVFESELNRNRLINDLLELQAFLRQLQAEMKNGSNDRLRE